MPTSSGKYRLPISQPSLCDDPFFFFKALDEDVSDWRAKKFGLVLSIRPIILAVLFLTTQASSN